MRKKSLNIEIHRLTATSPPIWKWIVSSGHRHMATGFSERKKNALDSAKTWIRLQTAQGPARLPAHALHSFSVNSLRKTFGDRCPTCSGWVEITLGGQPVSCDCEFQWSLAIVGYRRPGHLIPCP